MPNPTTIPNEPPTPAKGQPQTLAYSVPQRPAFVTALAVRCVCVAVVYAALSLVIAFGAFLILVSVGPPPIVTHPAAVLVVPRHARNEMLTTEERWVAFKALNAMLLLDPLISAHTPPASAELFTFLLFHGRAVLGGDDDVDPPLTAEAVRAAVKEYRTAAQ